MAADLVTNINWPGSSSFTTGSTPFGLYDNETLFQQHADKVGDWVAKTEHLNYVETFDNNGNRIVFKSYKPENPTQVFMEVRTSKDGGFIYRVYYDDGHLKEIYNKGKREKFFEKNKKYNFFIKVKVTPIK